MNERAPFTELASSLARVGASMTRAGAAFERFEKFAAETPKANAKALRDAIRRITTARTEAGRER